jgi:hypothetical protein
VTRRRGGLVLGVVCVVALSGAWVWRTHQQGAVNLTACGGLEPGGPRADLIQILGAPSTITANQAKTRVVLTFTSPLLAEKPIRAVVNVRDDVVMEIDCGDGRIKTYDKY